MAETGSTNTNKLNEELLEQILSRENLNRAYKQVKRNKGAGGKYSLCNIGKYASLKPIK
jgi:RNA-directed DNA polymerase